eukprot:786825-Prorocentrum_minimum.AAC.2
MFHEVSDLERAAAEAAAAAAAAAAAEERAKEAKWAEWEGWGAPNVKIAGADMMKSSFKRVGRAQVHASTTLKP